MKFLHSNYNVLTLSILDKDKYKVGDIYYVPEDDIKWRHRRFHGLEIEGIDYVFGTRLHFNYNDWCNNTPKKWHTNRPDTLH